MPRPSTFRNILSTPAVVSSRFSSPFIDVPSLPLSEFPLDPKVQFDPYSQHGTSHRRKYTLLDVVRYTHAVILRARTWTPAVYASQSPRGAHVPLNMRIRDRHIVPAERVLADDVGLTILTLRASGIQMDALRRYIANTRIPDTRTTTRGAATPPRSARGHLRGQHRVTKGARGIILFLIPSPAAVHTCLREFESSNRGDDEVRGGAVPFHLQRAHDPHPDSRPACATYGAVQSRWGADVSRGRGRDMKMRLHSRRAHNAGPGPGDVYALAAGTWCGCFLRCAVQSGRGCLPRTR
ncbi:hypothetical protein B0H11DRAFT_2298516 [Mycena galericulata]|nr:hypothetical protein B0H11DRAFT_2298516 [Mycena galericulata]